MKKILIRLRNQAEKCGFHKIEEHLIDQIAGNSEDLRKKILTIGDDITLDRRLSIYIKEANTQEVVKQQLDSYGHKAFSQDDRITKL